MKILVLNNDLMERTVIQQVIQEDRHEILPVENSAAAMQLLQEGGIRFVIADHLTTHMEQEQFIRRVREAQPPSYIYVLLLTPKGQEIDTTKSGADDFLYKPIMPLELRSRIKIGERILGLEDSLAQVKDALETSALSDSLTNILNHKAFLALSRGELERARRGQEPLSLIALDIDNFQAILQQFGEAIGRDVLTVVAQGIREKSRPYDGVGRYEADTFLIILPGVIWQDAERIAERILHGILNTDISLLDGTKVIVKLSAGIACSVHITASTEVELLIERALEAMKQARRDSSDQAVTVFV
jgi:diguanylate cyclase (GGDEF)-like protein